MIKRIGSIFFLYIFRNLAKNAKKSPIFSHAGGSHDQNGLNFTFFEISIVWNYGKKEIRFIATLTHILWFFEKNVIFRLSIHPNTKLSNLIWTRNVRGGANIMKCRYLRNFLLESQNIHTERLENAKFGCST